MGVRSLDDHICGTGDARLVKEKQEALVSSETDPRDGGGFGGRHAEESERGRGPHVSSTNGHENGSRQHPEGAT